MAHATAGSEPFVRVADAEPQAFLSAMRTPPSPSGLILPPETLKAWQEIVDIMAELIGIPAGLIMRLDGEEIEVLIASQGEGNPYRPGAREEVWRSGLYCERVLKTLDRLLVPDALADPAWSQNPDVRLGMISYLGFPILLPDRTPFGTICVLDRKENAYSRSFETLMIKFRDLVQFDLGLLALNQALGRKNEQLTDYLRELQALRGLVPVCANCKSIRDAHGTWRPLEHYLLRSPDTEVTHGICPQCLARLYPEASGES